MKDRAFVDTNVFVYAVDSRDPGKQSLARVLLRGLAADGTGVISSQVVLEYASNLIKKLSLSPLEAAERMDVFSPFACVSITPDLAVSALRLQASHSLSVWDAAIVAAAQTAGTTVLYSEDLQHGYSIGGLKIVNPFL